EHPVPVADGDSGARRGRRAPRTLALSDLRPQVAKFLRPGFPAPARPRRGRGRPPGPDPRHLEPGAFFAREPRPARVPACETRPSAHEVIRKRLLIDGDGAGDDRRINLLVKSFIKWCNSGSQEEGYSQYQRMLSTLSQCEFSMGKTLLVYDMNLREMENYEKIYKEIEYDALAKVIQHHPDRHETLKELEALGKELEHLSHIKESVEDKLELRRKQFHVLLSTIHELQQTLENDEKLSEVEEAQEASMETDPKP
uniref:THO complex subunit 7 homolog n=1 Tax=Capra hircus TaxID=9925 RepID=A0A8C2R4H7_CAPHI